MKLPKKSRKLAKAYRKQQERDRILGFWRSQQLAKKLAFGAPESVRKSAKIAGSWSPIIPGGATETQRRKH
jgi:hypothetical protein